MWGAASARVPGERQQPDLPMKRTYLLPIALVACTLAVPSARATLLLYDGFATATDDQSRPAYSTAANECKLQSDNAKSTA